MRYVLHRADSRGHIDHGWLKTWHSFSFGDYFNPQRVHFGKLRVLNDDIIDPGKGFGLHPHENMEIVTIPLAGQLTHADSAGHEQSIGPNEVQIMSAGTGIWHSEYNHSQDEEVRLFQIWVLPEQKGQKPRYDRKAFDPAARKNMFQSLASPDRNGLWLNQQAWFSRIDLDDGSAEYALNDRNHGVYVLIINGEATVEGHELQSRDAIGLWETSDIRLSAKEPAEILLIEIPMH